MITLTRLRKCISAAKNSPGLTHYITKGMEAFGCLPLGPSVKLQRPLNAASPPLPSIRHSLPATLSSTLSPPLLPPSLVLHLTTPHPQPPPLCNCYRSDLAGSSLSLHPGCFLRHLLFRQQIKQECVSAESGGRRSRRLQSRVPRTLSACERCICAKM